MKYLKWTGIVLLILVLILLITINVLPSVLSKSDNEILKELRVGAPNAEINYHSTSYGPLRYIMTDSSKSHMLLLIHGAPGDWSNYKQYLQDADLISQFNVVAVDRMGYGRSNQGKSLVSITDQTYAIQEVINHLLPDRLILVGHSYGGPISAYLSTINTETCSGVIMVAPVNNPDTEQIKWYASLAAGLRWILPGMINVATDEKFHHPKALKDISDIWQKITCPITHIHGTDDELADCESNISYSKDMIPPSVLTTVKLEKEGHLLIWDKYNLVKSTILKI